MDTSEPPVTCATSKSTGNCEWLTDVCPSRHTQERGIVPLMGGGILIGATAVHQTLDDTFVAARPELSEGGTACRPPQPQRRVGMRALSCARDRHRWSTIDVGRWESDGSRTRAKLCTGIWIHPSRCHELYCRLSPDWRCMSVRWVEDRKSDMSSTEGRRKIDVESTGRTMGGARD